MPPTATPIRTSDSSTCPTIPNHRQTLEGITPHYPDWKAQTTNFNHYPAMMAGMFAKTSSYYDNSYNTPGINTNDSHFQTQSCSFPNSSHSQTVVPYYSNNLQTGYGDITNSIASLRFRAQGYPMHHPQF